MTPSTAPEQRPRKRDGRAGKRTLVERTATALREMSLEVEDGAFLGAEPELIGKLEISRPTLRQAAKIVQIEQLIAVRRGGGGGFFARRPDLRQITAIPALYLRLRSATMEHMLHMGELLMTEAAALAADCHDPALRARLEDLRDQLEQDDPGTQPQREFIDRDAEILGHVAEMSGNPFLRLLIDILYAFGRSVRTRRIYEQDPGRASEGRGFQVALCDAILAHDAELAAVHTRRRLKLIGSWIEHDRNAGIPMEPL